MNKRKNIMYAQNGASSNMADLLSNLTEEQQVGFVNFLRNADAGDHYLIHGEKVSKNDWDASDLLAFYLSEDVHNSNLKNEYYENQKKPKLPKIKNFNPNFDDTQTAKMHQKEFIIDETGNVIKGENINNGKKMATPKETSLSELNQFLEEQGLVNLEKEKTSTPETNFSEIFTPYKSEMEALMKTIDASNLSEDAKKHQKMLLTSAIKQMNEVSEPELARNLANNYFPEIIAGVRKYVFNGGKVIENKSRNKMQKLFDGVGKQISKIQNRMQAGKEMNKGQEGMQDSCMSLRQSMSQLPQELQGKAQEALQSGNCDAFMQSLQEQADAGMPMAKYGIKILQAGGTETQDACGIIQQSLSQLPAEIQQQAQQAIQAGKCEAFIQMLQQQAQGNMPMAKKGLKFGMTNQEIQQLQDEAQYALDVMDTIKTFLF